MVRLANLTFIFWMLPNLLYAQSLLRPEVEPNRPASWNISATSFYTKNKLTTRWYPNTTIGVSYLSGSFRVGTFFNLNQRQNFSFRPPRLIIEVEDTNVQFSDSTRFSARPEIYDIEQTVRAFFQYTKSNLSLFTSLSTLLQRSEIEQPDIGAASDNLFVINWIPISRRKTNLLGSFGIGYTLAGLRFDVGAAGLSLIQFGDEGFKHEYRPGTTPFAGISWNEKPLRIGVATDFKSYTLSFEQTFRFRLLSDRTVGTSLDFGSGLEDFEFYALRLGMDLPLSPRLRASIAYSNVWSNPSSFDKTDFDQWQHSNSFGAWLPLNFNLPHQSVQLGISWTLDSLAPRWPLRVVNFRLFQPNIFAAKREFYATNPVATIDLLNESRSPVEVELFLKTTENSGTFRSPTFKVHPNEIKSVPLYFYLSNRDFDTLTKSEQLMVKAIVSDQSRILVSEPIRIYGKHAWDGNTWGLRYFVAPDDPTIKSRAKQVYLATLKDAKSPYDFRGKFRQVKTFIDEFGKSLKYVPDPTTSMDVDQVQYPVETYMKGGGDCEDLTVCMASGLMAVGMNAAVVDVRPKESAPVSVPTARSGTIGHVFLLVDTGIAAGFMAELDLNEFQAIIRKNPSGENTIWLPIETAYLSYGFDAALREGVKQYYHEVIEKNGVVKGNVHVYDF